MCMRIVILKTGFTGLLLVLLLGGCASQVPQMIREAPADSPTPEAVRDQLDDYLGQQVRWGGAIIETENLKDTTRLTVLTRPLFKDGEPRLTDDSDGRFIVIVPEFLDPQVYATARRVTITGTLKGSELDKVGEYPYRHPVVEADAWYLWPRDTDRYHYYDDPWYDPWWYDPYGFHPWGYRPSWYYRGYPYAYPYRYWR